MQENQLWIQTDSQILIWSHQRTQWKDNDTWTVEMTTSTIWGNLQWKFVQNNTLETTSQVEWHSKESKSASPFLQCREWLTQTTLRSSMEADPWNGIDQCESAVCEKWNICLTYLETWRSVVHGFQSAGSSLNGPSFRLSKSGQLERSLKEKNVRYSWRAEHSHPGVE